MNADAKAAEYAAVAHQWLEQQSAAAKEVALEFLGATNTTLSLKVKGMLFEVLLPSDLFQSEGPSAEMFIVTNVDNSAPDSLLMALHEKLERVRVGPQCLWKVLDVFPTVLKTFPDTGRFPSHNEFADARGKTGLPESEGAAANVNKTSVNVPHGEATARGNKLKGKWEAESESSAFKSAIQRFSREEESPAEPCSKRAKDDKTIFNPLMPAHMIEKRQILLREFHTISHGILKAKSPMASSVDGEPGARPFLSYVTVDMPENSSVCLWHIKLHKDLFQRSPRLRRDLEFLAELMQEPEAFILLEATFADKFPYDPPLIRILRPRYISQKGNVTMAGSICAEFLTRNGWLPSYTIETILVLTVNALIEDGGWIDLRGGRQYTWREARDAFADAVSSRP